MNDFLSFFFSFFFLFFFVLQIFCFRLISFGPLLDFFYSETEFGHVSEFGMGFG